MIRTLNIGEIGVVPYGNNQYGLVIAISECDGIWLYNDWLIGSEGELTGIKYWNMYEPQDWIKEAFKTKRKEMMNKQTKTRFYMGSVVYMVVGFGYVFICATAYFWLWATIKTSFWIEFPLIVILMMIALYKISPIFMKPLHKQIKEWVHKN